jgi:hypothetical protein
VAGHLKRYDWMPFVKTGGDLDRFLASESRLVHQVVGQLGIGG